MAEPAPYVYLAYQGLSRKFVNSVYDGLDSAGYQVWEFIDKRQNDINWEPSSRRVAWACMDRTTSSPQTHNFTWAVEPGYSTDAVFTMRFELGGAVRHAPPAA